MLSAGRRTGLMVVAAVSVAAAIYFPLWGMTLASIQYPEGLRLVVYPTRIVGDVTEINMLNGYIGMAKISRDFFVELRILPWALAGTALLTLAVAFTPRPLLRGTPLAALAAIAIYGFRSMATRMYEYGHELDPLAPIDIEPFTPPMFGENQIAQFGTYAYFSWGTFLPLLAGAMIALVVWADVRERRLRHDEDDASVALEPPFPMDTDGRGEDGGSEVPPPPAVRRRREATLRRYLSLPALMLAALVACAPQSDTPESADRATGSAGAAAGAPTGPSQADLDYEAITADWSDATREACGADLEEALGTRDLVAGVLAGVDDPDDRAEAEIEDARHWMDEGNRTLAEVRPSLEAGDCGAEAQTALEQTWQFYVKAGTSAVQASQMVGG